MPGQQTNKLIKITFCKIPLLNKIWIIYRNLIVTVEDNGMQLFYVLIGFKVKHYVHYKSCLSV